MTGQPFHEWLRARALAAGFDVDAAKGGRTALAEAAGMSVTQIGRTLDGKTTPSVESQRGLARALHVSFSEMLIKSGFATPEDFPEMPETVVVLDLYAVAEDLGVPEDRRAGYVDMMQAMAQMAREGWAPVLRVEPKLVELAGYAKGDEPPKFTEPSEASE